ncbi:glyoxalase-like domain-containing protein [Mycena pura]|uniref:Glyoxalase-like domain-containing protein n=1 Tax=Mycena pura TaxID=153505 RepID=A0AAD6VSN6_9AGAR|nr:glyoxalase-like domain-containing protein [Mycena pura]
MATSTLDHIVHLTPPGTVHETSEQWRRLGFNVIDGGVHTGGLTANSLVIIEDHTYLELIAFTQPPEAYPPGSPSRRAREAHKWAKRAPGWIDYACLGNGAVEGSRRISDIINARWNGTAPLYHKEVSGGRTRADGVVLEWVISAPEREDGVLPFFCGDVTDRRLRVPTQQASNTRHPCGARGVAHIRIIASEADFALACDELSAALGALPFERATGKAQWHLSTLNGLRSPTLVLATPRPADQDEVQFVAGNLGPGIYEVGFWVGEGGEEGSVMSPFGKIVWVK